MKSKTIAESIEETRRYHERYFRAVNSPLRRNILRALKENPATFEELKLRTELSNDTLKWHLSVLESGFCVEKDNKQGKLIYKLTQEGKIVDYIK